MRKIKKFVAVGMAIVVGLFTGMSLSVINDYDSAYAKINSDDEINIKYNSKYYTEYVMSRGTITMYSQYGSMWSDLDEDDELGEAIVRFCYLEPKDKLDGKYQAICCCQVSMEPETVKGNISGMSQLADIKIETINENSRVCAPTVSALDAQESKSKSKGGSFTAGATISYDIAKESLTASGSLNYGKTWGASTTYSYNSSNVELIQKNNDNYYAHWNYDYISHDGNKTWNAYLFSSSKVAGLVSYRLSSKPTASNRKKCCMSEVVCDIRFGAGNIKNGKVADRLGPSTNREMAIEEVTYTFSF